MFIASKKMNSAGADKYFEEKSISDIINNKISLTEEQKNQINRLLTEERTIWRKSIAAAASTSGGRRRKRTRRNRKTHKRRRTAK